MKKIIAIILSVSILFACGCSSNKAVKNSPEITVYITKTGDCYHRANCSYLKKSKIAISLKNAIDEGYSRCSKCNPQKATN